MAAYGAPGRALRYPRGSARGLLHHRPGHSLCLALPVVVKRAKPVAFRAWWPGMRMRPGTWDIPVPDGGEWVRPEALLVPLLGFDPRGYRLGYGGGYYDRTLGAAKPTPPLAIGVGFEIGRLETIHPQPHDVPVGQRQRSADPARVERRTPARARDARPRR